MGRKIIKWIFRILLIILGLLLLLSILVYLPPVQSFIKNKASSIVYNSTGMELSIDRFRLRFPLNVSVDNTTIVTPQGDTLLRAGQVSTDVALWPLFAGKVKVRQLELKDIGVHYIDTLSAMTFIASLDEFSVGATTVTFKNDDIRISGAELRNADIALWMGESHKVDTVQTDTVPMLWKINLERFDIDRLGFRMYTEPEVTELSVELPSGRIDKVAFDMGGQDIQIDLIRLQEGKYAYLTDTATLAQPPVIDPADSLANQKPDSTFSASMDWKIRLNRLELTNNGVNYGVSNGQPQSGFDFDHIELSGLNVQIDDIRFSENDLGANIKQLEAKERSGLEITHTSGTFTMDSVSILLHEFNLLTTNSSISAEADIAAGLLTQDPTASLSAHLQAALSPVDLYYFYEPDSAMRRTLAGQTLRLDGDFSGTLAQLRINTLSAQMPGHIDFRADGRVVNILEPDHLGGDIRLNGAFTDLEFLNPMLPDSVRGRIGFPERMTLSGSLAMAGNTYEPILHLAADSGFMNIKARVDLNREIYDADITVSDFPLYAFLPKDSLGILSLNLSAKGQHFDPRQEGAESDIEFSLGELGFQGYVYRDIALNARISEHRLTGELSGNDPSLRLRLGLNGELRPEKYQARLTGKIDTVNLYRMGFMPDVFDASLLLDASVEGYADSLLRADLMIDSVRIQDGYHNHKVKQTTLKAESDRKHVMAALRSGDLTLDFNAPVSIDSLLTSLSRATGQVMEQVDARRLDMEHIQETLPPFRLEASAGQDNVLHSVMKTQGVDFRSIEMTATTLDDRPLRAGVVVHSLKTAGLTLDTLNLGMRRRDRQLDYFVRLANRPGNIDDLALLAVAGKAVDNTASLNVYQRNRLDSVGFRFGFAGELLDSSFRVRMTPEKPILGYDRWQVNPDNYIVYHFNKSLEADLKLEGPSEDQHIYITSRAFPPVLPDGAIKLDMKGIRIAPLLELYPSSPDIAGILNTDVGFGFNHDKMITLGNVEIKDLFYEQKRVGDIATGVALSYDNLDNLILKGRAQIDGETVLRADGTYLALGEGKDGGMSIRVDIPGIPLASVNAFLPEDMAELSGTLTGWTTLKGINTQFDGELRVTEGKLHMPITGTTYRFIDRPVIITNNKIDFNRFGLTAPNDQNLTIRGTLDFSDASHMMADMSLNARNFEAINSSRRGGSPVYGKAPIDVNLTAKGAVDALTIRGNLKLRRGTNVTYTLQEGRADVEDVKQDIVTFVNFNDPDTFAPADSARSLNIFGMDLLVSIDIEENIEATVNLTKDGNNRAELSGNGNLTFTMNRQGDSRFMGRFNVASGLMLLSLPVISQKDFKINEGSNVEWTGEMMNPLLNITASDDVRISVTDESKQKRTVNFIVSVLLRNSLADLDLIFDLAAPNDAIIGPELATLTPEQRSQQALSVLINNAYSGVGGKSEADFNPLNSFISRELNQWARNSLPGIDLSVGLETADDEVGGGQHTNYSYQVSKSFMNDRIRVSIGGSFNPDTTGENVQNNFVDDVSVEYRLTERDNMYIKGYRYTTQDMLEGEIIETGGGFLYRKKMNKFKDLFKLNKRRGRSGQGQGQGRNRDAQEVQKATGENNGQQVLPEGENRRRRTDRPENSIPGDQNAQQEKQPVLKEEEATEATETTETSQVSQTPEQSEQPDQTAKENVSHEE